MAELMNLGTASLDIEANLLTFERNVKQAEKTAGGLERTLDAVAAAGKIAERELDKVKLNPRNGASSQITAREILAGVKGVSREALDAADSLDRVKLDERNAAETAAAAAGIKHELRGVTGEANEARRALTSVRLAGGIPGRSGVGVGFIGSGYGRVGALGAAIGLGVLTGPAAGPAAGGLLAAIPTLAAGATGALGTLVLALQGVGKAIGGDKKAFDELVPAQQKFVLEVRSLTGWIDKLKQTAAGNMFPGLTKGLHEALSPGTVAAISSAVGELARAIGQAGEQWGRYFGSAQFQQLLGPLMQAGARNLTVLSDAFLHLFDALSVLGRAAIPFTAWLNEAIDRGARLASSWMRAKEASGELGGALREAQTSLRLVGGLFEALLRAVGALGSALYPVSKILVRDLTDGLNALAGIISRNRQTIRDLVSGALTGLVFAVKTAAEGVGTLWHALENIQGHDHAVRAAIIGLGAVLAASLGPTSLAITGAILAVGLLKTHWSQFADWFEKLADRIELAIAEPFSHLPSILGEWARNVKLVIQQTQADMEAFANGTKVPTTPPPNVRNAKSGLPGQGRVYAAGTGVDLTNENPALLAALQELSAVSGLRLQVTSGYRSYAKQKYLWDNADKLGLIRGVTVAKPGSSEHQFGRAADVMAIVNGRAVPLTQAVSAGLLAKVGLTGIGPKDAVHVQLASSASGLDLGKVDLTGGTSPFGSQPPFTTNLGPKPPKPPVIPNRITDLLNRAGVNASKAGTLSNMGGTARRYLENELAELQTAQKALQKLAPDTAREKQQVAAKLASVKEKIITVRGLIKKSALEIGDALLPDRLKTELAASTAKFKADSAFAQVLTGKAAENYADTVSADIVAKRDTLEKMVAGLKSKLGGATGRQKTEIQKELTKINGQLAEVQQQVVDTLRGKVQTLQGHVRTFFQSVQQSLDQQFDLATQKLLDQAATDYYQNGSLTPLEQQLASMRYQDQLKSLQDAVAAATTDAERRAAQRALDEFNLEQAASKERAQADRDYAAKVKQIQAERAQTEAEMNRKLEQLGAAFENGSGSMADLTAIATAYGIQIDTTTIPDFDNLSSSVTSLQEAFVALADYIAQLTGTRPQSVSDYTRQPSGSAVAGIPVGGSVTDAYRRLLAAGADSATARYLAKGLSIPLLDTGGRILAEGLAYLHTGEEVVQAAAVDRTGGMQEARVASIGNEVELGVYLGGLMKSANRRGIRFQLV